MHSKLIQYECAVAGVPQWPPCPSTEWIPFFVFHIILYKVLFHDPMLFENRSSQWLIHRFANFAIAVYLRASDKSASSFKTTELQDEFSIQIWKVFRAGLACASTQLLQTRPRKNWIAFISLCNSPQNSRDKKIRFFVVQFDVFLLLLLLTLFLEFQNILHRHRTTPLLSSTTFENLREENFFCVVVDDSDAGPCTRLTFSILFIHRSFALNRNGDAVPSPRSHYVLCVADWWIVAHRWMRQRNASFCFCFIRPSLVFRSLVPGRMFCSDKYLYTLCRLQSVNCKHRSSIFCMLGFGKWWRCQRNGETGRKLTQFACARRKKHCHLFRQHSFDCQSDDVLNWLTAQRTHKRRQQSIRP